MTAPRRWRCCKQDAEIEILLTDLGLPGMNGRQLVEEALRLKPALKVIIASGYSDREAGDDKLAGAADHLTKPFDLEQLKRVLWRTDKAGSGHDKEKAREVIASRAFVL